MPKDEGEAGFIGTRLKRLYGDVAGEPIPEEMAALLAKLGGDKAGGATGGQGAAGRADARGA